MFKQRTLLLIIALSALMWTVGCGGDSAPADAPADAATEAEAPADVEAEADAEVEADAETDVAPDTEATESDAMTDSEEMEESDEMTESEGMTESEETTESGETTEEADTDEAAESSGDFQVGDCTRQGLDASIIAGNFVKVSCDDEEAQSRIEEIVDDIRDCPEGMAGVSPVGPDNPNYCIGPLESE